MSHLHHKEYNVIIKSDFIKKLREKVMIHIFKCFFIATFLLILPLLASASTENTLNITGYWVRPATGENTAAYMTMNNPTPTADKLIKAECAFAETVELHNHINDNGVMRMRPVNDITVPANTDTTMKPGGLHIMLMRLKPEFKNQKTVPITLHFEKQGVVTLNFPVQVPAFNTPS